MYVVGDSLTKDVFFEVCATLAMMMYQKSAERPSQNSASKRPSKSQRRKKNSTEELSSPPAPANSIATSPNINQSADQAAAENPEGLRPTRPRQKTTAKSAADNGFIGATSSQQDSNSLSDSYVANDQINFGAPQSSNKPSASRSEVRADEKDDDDVAADATFSYLHDSVDAYSDEDRAGNEDDLPGEGN